MPSWFQSLFYQFCKLISYFAMMLGFSLRFEGGRRIPHKGAVLIVGNHQSMFDPVLVGVTAPRHLTYLARKTLFDNPVFGWLIRSLQAVPVDQEGVAKEGMLAILRALKQEQAVLIFPEGSRSEDGKLGPLQRGIALLIERSGAAVLPVGVAGAFDALPRRRLIPRLAPVFLPKGRATVAVYFGHAIAPEELATLSRPELLERLRKELETVSTQAEGLRRKG
jgi:1-acyl-sn-glycerol-3-phosphate acyltransferase